MTGEDTESDPHRTPDLISILLLSVISQAVLYSRGRSANHLAPMRVENRSDFGGQEFSARTFFISTAGRDHAAIRAGIVHAEEVGTRPDL